MNPLMERAKKTVDQAELYWSSKHEIDVRYENYRLQAVTENDLSSVALRVIKEGKSGATYGVDPEQPNLLEEAAAAAEYGDPATFSFAPAAEYPQVANYDERTAKLSSADLVEICESIKRRIAPERPDIPLLIQAGVERKRLGIETTNGAEASEESTGVGAGFGAPIKGAGIGVFKSYSRVQPKGADDEVLEVFL